MNTDKRHLTAPEPMTTERETQITDGLRWADSMLASFGMQPGHIDVSALVALRALEWADDDMPIREARRILRTITTTPVGRKVQ
jgi:hypothetical protein